MNQLLEMVKHKNDLPALPDIVIRINEKLSDPECGIDDIAALIKSEPVLAGKIVQLANSAFFSGGRLTISDLGLVVGRLGLKEVRNFIYAISLLNLYKDQKIVDQIMFWRHSLSVALCSQALSRIMKLDAIEQDRAYMSGLMHDIELKSIGV